MPQSLGTRDYLKEFYKLDFNDRQEPGNELMLNQLGYFMFDVLRLDAYTSNMHIVNNLYKADKIYLFGSYSYVYAALEALIENGLQEQVIMLDIEINNWDSIYHGNCSRILPILNYYILMGVIVQQLIKTSLFQILLHIYQSL